jgi:hypothetical protein
VLIVLLSIHFIEILLSSKAKFIFIMLNIGSSWFKAEFANGNAQMRARLSSAAFSAGSSTEKEGNKRMARTLQVAPRATRKTRSAKASPTLEQIQVRAYEIYLERQGAPGNQIEDWLQAERELLLNGPAKPRKTTRSPKAEAA